MSGIFFRPTTVRDFLKKKPRQLLIPFLAFYFISIPFQFVVSLWDYGDASAFEWFRIWDIFAIEGRSDYLSLNVPLWFLLTLFMIQAISMLLFRLPRKLILLSAIIAFLFKDELLSWPTPFMFNNALHWYAYFAIGYLLGKPFVIRLLKDHRFRITTIAVAAAIFILTALTLSQYDISDMRYVIRHTNYLSFIISTLALFSATDGLPFMRSLNWIGTFTLEILCTHLFIMIPLNRIYGKLFEFPHPIAGFIITALTLMLLNPVIRFLNDCTPRLIGKTPMV